MLQRLAHVVALHGDPLPLDERAKEVLPDSLALAPQPDLLAALSAVLARSRVTIVEATMATRVLERRNTLGICRIEIKLARNFVQEHKCRYVFRALVAASQ